MAFIKYKRERDGATVYAAVYYAPDGSRRVEQARVVPKTTKGKPTPQRDHSRAENAAKNLADERVAEIENGTWTDPRAKRADEKRAALTFGELVAEFLKDYRTKAGSITYYEQRAALWVERWDKRPAGAITPADVERFRNARAEEVGPSTVKKDLTALAVFYNWAMARGHVDRNPAGAKLVKRPAEPTGKNNYLADEQEAALLKVCNEWLALVVRFAIGSGMDREEIVLLTWDAVDEKAGVITAPRSKTGVPRQIPLNVTLRSVLADAKARAARLAETETPKSRAGNVAAFVAPAKAEDREAMAALDAGGRVFLGEHGDPLTVEGLKTAVRKAYTRAGVVTRQQFKVFRHTFASRLAMKDVPAHAIARLLGQKTEAIVDRYMYLSPSYLRGAMNTLDAPSAQAEAAAK